MCVYVCVRARVYMQSGAHLNLVFRETLMDIPELQANWEMGVCVCAEWAPSPPSKVRFVRAGGRACSLSLQGFGVTRDQTELGHGGPAPSSDLGLEATN